MKNLNTHPAQRAITITVFWQLLPLQLIHKNDLSLKGMHFFFLLLIKSESTKVSDFIEDKKKAIHEDNSIDYIHNY